MTRQRTLVIGALAVFSIALIVVIAGSGGSSSPQPSGGATAKHEVRKKPARRPATGATGAVKYVHGRHDKPVPILMYHVIKSPPPGAQFPQRWVPSPIFKAQMESLASQGYHGVTLTKLFDYWNKGVALPSKPIVISFDDGYPSQYHYALPELKNLHWPGVLNLETDNLRTAQSGFRSSMVKAMIAAGWEIDSHSVSNPDMTSIGAREVKKELVDSKRILQQKFGVPAAFFCYPAGQYNDAVVAAVKAAGYKGATTTDYGRARPGSPFTLKRIPVNGDDGVSGLNDKLTALERGAPAPTGTDTSNGE